MTGMQLSGQGFHEDQPIDLHDLALGGVQPAPARLTIEMLVERVIASQRAAGEAIDPNSARKLIRALVALGLLQVG